MAGDMHSFEERLAYNFINIIINRLLVKSLLYSDIKIYTIYNQPGQSNVRQRRHLVAESCNSSALLHIQMLDKMEPGARP